MADRSEAERRAEEEQKGKLIDQVLELQTTLDGAVPRAPFCLSWPC